jgi:hypothetical protein
MIALNTPTPASPSLAVSREGGVADRIQALWEHSGTTGGSKETATFSWQVLELDTTFPDVLRPQSDCADADFPTVHAMSTARALCADVDRILGETVSFADLEAFDGDLLIHWRSPDRSMTLICPAGPDRKAKLYREELSPGAAVKSDITAEPRASDIARAIRWVWNKG